jgi:hypothetical protein
MKQLCLDKHENLRKIIIYIPISFHCKVQHQRLWDYNPQTYRIPKPHNKAVVIN